MMRHRLHLLIVAAAVAAVPAFGGTSSVEDQIEARRGYCRLIGHNTDLIFEMAKGDQAYDAQLAADLAENLRVLSAMELGALWLEGSDSASMPGKTAMLPAAIKNFRDYARKRAMFQEAASDLAESADSGLFTMRLMLDRVGETCAACHEAYMAKDLKP